MNIAIVGMGTVGGAAIRLLEENAAELERKLGFKLHIRATASLEVEERKEVDTPTGRRLLTRDWREAVEHPEADIVVEVVGDTTIAYEVQTTALALGRPVVTANKELLGLRGAELAQLARDNKTSLHLEASAGGCIPILNALREGIAADHIEAIYGILNGTCNYILTQMEAEGSDFEDVLADAQQMGYAEAEPSLDVDGFDAQHKTGILASLAHGFWVKPEKVYTEGIRHVAPLDLEFAGKLGHAVKLLGIVKTSKTGPVQVTMFPALIPNDHVLANVSDVYNGILVRGDVVGDTLYYGQGAGQDATASAVLSDIGDAVLDLAHGTTERMKAFNSHEANGAVRPIDEVTSCYYLRLTVLDRPGVLAKVSTILAKNKIGISSVIQPEGHEGKSVPLIFMLHYARNAAMTRALKAINKLAAVKAKPVMIRVENFE